MVRTTVICIVEGQTENAVLKHLVVPHLARRGIDLHVPIIRIGQGRGGVRGLQADTLYDQIRRFLRDSSFTSRRRCSLPSRRRWRRSLAIRH